jgi:hypothetical protein
LEEALSFLRANINPRFSFQAMLTQGLALIVGFISDPEATFPKFLSAVVKLITTCHD